MATCDAFSSGAFRKESLPAIDEDNSLQSVHLNKSGAELLSIGAPG